MATSTTTRLVPLIISSTWFITLEERIYPRGNWEDTTKFLRKKEDPRTSNLFLFLFPFLFFFLASILKFLFIPPAPPFFSCQFTHSLLQRLYSSTSQYLSQCRVTEERINMYRETCCHFKARTAVAFILSSRRYVHEGNAPLGKVNTYVQWNSIWSIGMDNSLLDPNFF